MGHGRTSVFRTLPSTRTARRLTALALVLAAALGATLRRPNPASGLKLADGWRAELIAQAPAIVFPTAIVAAPDGTIYLGQDPMDMPGPPTEPVDSVVAIRNGKVSVFADKLWAVMGLEWVGDTLYVVHAPYLSAFRDTDCDGRADERVDLITGLGPKIPGFNGINDHVASGLRLGMDGFLYIAVGDKGIPRGVAKDGTTIRLHGGGVIRIRPDGSGLEVVSTGERNPLSVALSDRDEVFTFGNDDDSKRWPNSLTHHIIGGHYGYPYEFEASPDRALPILGGRVGGAGAQGIAYRDDGLAPRFRGNLFFCDWGLGAVTRYDVERHGATYRIKDQEYVVRRGGVRDFRPFSLANSPDGDCLYLVDWAFNGFLVDGPQTGRLYRLTYHGPDRVRPHSPSDDLATLGHPAYSARLRAQRSLAARGESVVEPLAALMLSPGDANARVHALWALDAINTPAARAAIRRALGTSDKISFPPYQGGTEGSLGLDQAGPEETPSNSPLVRGRVLNDALKSYDPDLKTQAARALGIRRDRPSLDPLRNLLAARDPTARREAAIALGRIGDPAASPSLSQSLGDDDPFAAWSIRGAIRAIGRPDVETLTDALRDPRRRDDALKLCDRWYDPAVVSALANSIRTSDDPNWKARVVPTLADLYRKVPEWSGHWFGANPLAGAFPRATEGWDASAMTGVFESLAAALGDPDPLVRRAAIAGLAGVGDRSADRLCADLARESDPTNRAALAQTLGRLNVSAAVPGLAGWLADKSQLLSVRDAALEALEAIDGAASREARNALARDAKSPAVLVARTLPTLARLGVIRSGELIPYLGNRSSEVRAAAVRSLSLKGTADEAVRKAVVGRLDDPSAEVRSSAIEAAAALGLRDALPRLIGFAAESTTRAEAVRALATMPDPQALAVYLDALDDRNPQVREDGERGLLAVRESARADLESRLASGIIKGQPRLAVERALAHFEPIQEWRLIGPFPRNAPRLFDDPTAIDFGRESTGAGGLRIAWNRRTADPSGRLLIDDLKGTAGDHDLSGSPDLAAFAYTEVRSDRDRPALILIGSSGTVSLAIDGKPVHHAEHAAGRPFDPESDLVPVGLKAGVNRLVVRTRQGIGPWSFAVRLATTDHAGPREIPKGVKDLRRYALAHPGDARRGEALFFDPGGVGCARCHSAGGRGSARVGPDLSTLAANYDREEIVRSVLEPSARIANGYQPVVLARPDGSVLTGLVVAEDDHGLDLIDAEGARTRVPRPEIEARRAGDVSLMPAGLVDTLKPEEFADLVAYLASLNGHATRR